MSAVLTPYQELVSKSMTPAERELYEYLIEINSEEKENQ